MGAAEGSCTFGTPASSGGCKGGRARPKRLSSSTCLVQKGETEAEATS